MNTGRGRSQRVAPRPMVRPGEQKMVCLSSTNDKASNRMIAPSYPFSPRSSPVRSQATQTMSKPVSQLNSYGPKCQSCSLYAGDVVLDVDSGSLVWNTPLFIVPECGHRVCKKCRNKGLSQQYCNVCSPIGPINNGVEIENQLTHSDAIMDLVAAGMILTQKSSLCETRLDEFSGNAAGGSPTLSTSSRYKRINALKQRKTQNAMFANAAATSVDDNSNANALNRDAADDDCNIAYKLTCNFCIHDASILCDVCNSLSCEFCFKQMHDESKKFHQAVTFVPSVESEKQADALCESHQAPVRLFCSTCDVRLCPECWVECVDSAAHKDHQVSRISDKKPPAIDSKLTLEQTRRFCSDLEQSSVAVSNSIKSLISSTQNKSEQINAFYLSLFALLQVKLTQDHTRLSEFCQTKMEELKRCLNNFNNLLKYSQFLLEQVENNALDEKRSHLFLQKMISLQKIPSCFKFCCDDLDNLIEVKKSEEIVEFAKQFECVKLTNVKNAAPLGVHNEKTETLKQERCTSEALRVTQVLESYCKNDNEVKRRSEKNESDDRFKPIKLIDSSIDNQNFVKVGDIIKLTHFRSPVDFYFTRVDSEKDLLRLGNELQLLVKSANSTTCSTVSSLSDLLTDQFILAKFYADGCWYRAKVIGKKTTSEADMTKEKVVVNFIDYGNNAMLEDINDILIPSIDCNLHCAKPFCMRGLLDNITVLDATQSKKDSLFYFESLVANKNFVVANVSPCTLSDLIQLDLYECDIFIGDFKLYNDYPASLAHALVFAKHAKFVKKFDFDNAMTSNTVKIDRFTVLKEEIGSMVECAITEVVDPSKFYCRLVNEESELVSRKLQSEIDFYIEHHGISENGAVATTRLSCPYVGMYCLAAFDSDDGSTWFYRAQVINVNQHRCTARVFFLDFGNISDLKLSRLRKIPLRFLQEYPPVLFECKMIGILPNIGEKCWSQKAIAATKHLIMDKKLSIKIVSSFVEESEKKYNVEVYSNPCIKAADILCSKGVVRKEEACSMKLKVLVGGGNINGSTRNEGSEVELAANCDDEDSPISLSDIYNAMSPVVLGYFEDPWHFFVRKSNATDKNNPIDPIDTIIDAFKHAVETNGLVPFDYSQLSPSGIELRNLKLAVLTQLPGEGLRHHRCRITTVAPVQENQFEVQLIDHGSKMITSSDNLYHIKDSEDNVLLLSTGGLAMACSLTSVYPAGSTDGKWSNSSKEALLRLFENGVYAENKVISEVESNNGVSFSSSHSKKTISEIYHIDPKCPKDSVLMIHGDFVPVSHFLKINGLAIPAKFSIPKEEKNINVNNSCHLSQTSPLCNKGQIKATREIVSPKTGNKINGYDVAHAVTSVSVELPVACSEEINISCPGAGRDKKRLSWENDDSTDEDEDTPTVRFTMPEKSVPVKTVSMSPNIEIINNSSPSSVRRDSLTDYCNDLDQSRDLLSPAATSNPLDLVVDKNQSGAVNMASKLPLKFVSNQNISFEDSSSISGFSNVPFFCPEKTLHELEESICFDLSSHGMREFRVIDECGDTHYKIDIVPGCFYKEMVLPSNQHIFPFQFETYSEDGVSFSGTCNIVNEKLKERINSQISEFIGTTGGFHCGDMFKDEDLYENMAACGVYTEDKNWYRVKFIGKIDENYLVKFVDFGNEISLERPRFFPMGAFTDVPIMSSDVKLHGVSFRDENINAKLYGPYRNKMRQLLLTDEHKLFIGIKENTNANAPNHKYLVSVYCEKHVEMRHFLVKQGYLKWSIQPHQSLKTAEEQECYQQLVKSFVPLDFTFLADLIGEKIRFEVLQVVSNQLLLANVVNPFKNESFNKFIKEVNGKMPSSESRIEVTDSSIGQLVYAYDRRFDPMTWQRGQIMGLVHSGEFVRFSVYMFDHGVTAQYPPSASLQVVHNLHFFLSQPARAVPVFIHTNSNETVSSLKLVSGSKFDGELVEVVDSIVTVKL